MNLNSLSRRALLKQSACGFGSLALAGLCQRASGTAPHASPIGLHHRPRAKRVIFLFMQGGPSQVDSFDYKPALAKYADKKVEFDVARTMRVSAERVFPSPWKFSRYGRSGQWVSDLFPSIGRQVDDICQLRGMHTEGVAHGPATLFLHTGATNLIRPSVGSWITYGLGTENQNLPAFITICPTAAKGGPRNYNNGFLPAQFQGTAIGRAGVPVGQAGIRHVTNGQLSFVEQQEQLDLLQALNRQQLSGSPDDDALEAAIGSFELAFRMQKHAPQVMDLTRETATTNALYGIGEKETDDFGRQCLLARRFAEAGVRFIQVNYADNSNNPRWDQHSNIQKHEFHAKAVDKPVAGLLQDLKARGLLEDTLVWFGGEFGRTPFAQGNDGRDHNPKGFTVWLAGGGVQAGTTYGATDEFGYTAAVDRVHMHDLHATIMHLLGTDHERLTYRHAGRDFRLTDLYGRVVSEIFA